MFDVILMTEADFQIFFQNSSKFRKVHMKHLCQSLFLIKNTLLKNRIWHRGFTVNFAKEHLFLQNTAGVAASDVASDVA